MFEKLVIRQPLGAIPAYLSLGRICEALVFYNKVQLVLDFGRLGCAISCLGAANLKYLLDNDFISITYTIPQVGTQTDNVGTFSLYQFTEFTFRGQNPNESPRKAQIDRILLNAGIDGKAGKEFRKSLGSKTTFARRYSQLTVGGQDPIAGAVAEVEACSDLADRARIVLSQAAPTLTFPDDWRLRAIGIEGGLVIESNYDLEGKLFAYNSENASNVTTATVMHSIFCSYLDLSLGAHYASEILVSPESSKLLGSTVAPLLVKAHDSNEKIGSFTEFALGDCGSISTAIDSGQRSFEQFKVVLERSRGFRNWLSDINPDADLAKEYHSACLKDDWIESNPAKALRLVAFSLAPAFALGAVDLTAAIAAGTALSAFDSMILSSIAGGWRPNQFVDQDLKDFVDCNPL